MLSLTTSDGATWFKPGTTIEGSASWHIDDGAEALEVRLFWYTSGKGSQDVNVMASLRIDNPGTSGSRNFQLAVPRGPYSFSGKLITLAWALEIVVLPDGDAERFDLVIGPRPVEVDIS